MADLDLDGRKNRQLEALRERLIQTALEIDLMVEAIEKILIPTGLELSSPKPVRWGKTDPADYGKPSTRLITEQEALAHADQRIIEGYAPPLTFELDSAATIALDDDSDPNEGRYDRED